MATEPEVRQHNCKYKTKLSTLLCYSSLKTAPFSRARV